MLKKFQLSSEIAKTMSISNESALEIYEKVCECIQKELIKNKSVSLGNLGKLIIKEKRSRVVINNLTNTKYCVGKRNKVEFHASKKLIRTV